MTSVEALFSDKINYDIFRSELHQKVFLTSVEIQMNSQLKATACSEGNAGGGAAGASGRSSGSSPVNSSPQLQRPCSPMDIAATKIQAAFRGHRVSGEMFLNTLKLLLFFTFFFFSLTSMSAYRF